MLLIAYYSYIKYKPNLICIANDEAIDISFKKSVIFDNFNIF